jgi:hypothetical protein
MIAYLVLYLTKTSKEICCEICSTPRKIGNDVESSNSIEGHFNEISVSETYSLLSKHNVLVLS